jgi:potassium channel subfamily K
MMFFLWLAGGAAVFSRIEGWSYVNGLYFCDVTILTIGFGDYYPRSNLGRGLVFPFSVGGTIILGLMVSSIHKFAGELSKDKVLRKHMETRRVNTLSRAVTLSPEEQRRDDLEKKLEERPGYRPTISSPIVNIDSNERQIQFATAEEKVQSDVEQEQGPEPAPSQFITQKQRKNPILQTFVFITAPVRTLTKVTSKNNKAIVMKEEKDRFDAMRNIQTNAAQFKKWYALLLSVIAFGILWCVGAIVFWQCEKNIQPMTYFQALYFCYVSLLTIGYGDLSPKSNAGKPFFVVWSLIAVPTMTILISDMGDTVISSFKRGTFKLADFTVLPKTGLLKEIVDSNPWIKEFIQRRAERKRIKKGLQPEGNAPNLTIDELVNEDLSETELTRRLAFAIRRTAEDMKLQHRRRYTYEEWVEFTRLIRFTKFGAAKDLEQDEEAEGIVEWDWLSESSPILSEQSEAEWVLDRLCESLLRLLKKKRLANIASPNGADDLDPIQPLNKFGFGPVEGRGSEDQIDPRQKGPDRAVPEPRISPLAERRQRAVGADKLLTFFTGERRGAHAYANREPLWSPRALERINERRRSSAALGARKKGPFKMIQSRTGAMGGGRGGAGTRTLKARAIFGSV